MRKLPTGEPYAGKPPVRFGGRGGESLPYPYSAMDGNLSDAQVRDLGNAAGHSLPSFIS
jgi:hypothetical protein